MCAELPANETAGKQLVFVTNNSTKSRADYKKKFDKVGIEAKEVSRGWRTWKYSIR